MSPEQISVIPDLPKLNIFLYCQFGPFFEVYIGPNLIWAKFGITEICSGLIGYNWLYLKWHISKAKKDQF